MLTRFRYICILVLLSLTWIPSAQAELSAENRVRGFDFEGQILIRGKQGLSADRHLDFSYVYDEVAVEYRLASRAGAETVQRAMSRAELKAMQDKGLVRGGRKGTC